MLSGQACSFYPAEPDCPDRVYVVMSDRAGKFARAGGLAWDAGAVDFVEIPLTIG
jgi:hypothetical protein